MDEAPTVEADAEPTLRKAILALSLGGAAAMAATSLLQLGVLDDLPDPKRRLFGLPFRSRKVNLSDEAYVLGLRDSPVALAGFLANIPWMLAIDRALSRRRRWMSLAFATKAFGEAAGAVIFFSKMPREEQAWCAYCIGAAVASVGIFALSIPAAARAAPGSDTSKGGWAPTQIASSRTRWSASSWATRPPSRCSIAV